MGKSGKHGTGRVYQPSYKDKKTGESKTVEHFYIQWYDSNGDQRREAAKNSDGSLCYTEKDARAVLTTKLADAHRNVNQGPVNSKGLRYADVRELVLKHHRKNDLRSLETLSDGNDSLKGLTELDVYAGFKSKSEEGKYSPTGEPGMRVSDLGNGSWDDFVLRRKQEGVSKSTVRSSAKLLRRMLKLGVKANMIAKANDVFAPPNSEPREDCLYREDFERLVGNGSNGFIADEFVPVVTFMFYQGVRVNETLNIVWGQIDFDTNEYRPSRTKTKTGDTTAKPLKDVVVAILKKMKGKHTDSERVFEDVRSGGKNIAKRLEGAFRNAMLEMKPVTGFGENKGPAGSAWRCSWCQTIYRDLPAPKDSDKYGHVCPTDECKRDRVPLQYRYVGPSIHSLRASCAVYYLEKGLPDSAVQRVTGHKDAKVFHGYCRFRTSNLADMMNVPEPTRRGKKVA